MEYDEVLDQLHEILIKFDSPHDIKIGGDWPSGVQLLVFFCFAQVQVVLFDTPGTSMCRLQRVSVESSSLLHHSIHLIYLFPVMIH